MNRSCRFSLLLFCAILGLITPACAHASPAKAFGALVADAKAAMMTDPSAAGTKARQAGTMLSAFRGRDRLNNLATVKWLEGEAYLRLDDPQSAAPLIAAALASVKQLGKPTKLTGDILISRGDLDTVTANVARALQDFQQAHDIFRQINDPRSRAKALLFMAMLYGEANDWNNTIKYSIEAENIYKDDPTLSISIFNNLSQAYKSLGRYDQAEEQLRNALKVSQSMRAPGLSAHVLRNIARVELMAGHLAQADRTIATAMPLARVGPPDERTFLLATAAQAALQHGRLPQADALVRQSLTGVDLDTTPTTFREIHQTAYDIFRRTGDDASALDQLAALKRLDDKATQLATSANTALLGARFDFANQELRIAKLKADELQRKVEYERERARTERLIFVGVGGATLVIMAMLAIGLITIRRSRNEVRRANVDLAESNSALGKALAAKTEFLATTSHEIRTPLNGILGMTQVMLADPAIGAATRDRIGIVHGAGVTMRALVDDILDVAKMETGNLAIESVPMNLCATLTDVVRLWEEQARDKGLGFTLEVHDCPADVLGDPARLRQVVFNLLSNALKFTAAGAITVRAAALADDPSRYVVTVTDTGIGIAAAKLEDVFESFRQADAGTTRQFGGTGLGLAICRNLARAMGGDVTVASTPGVGSIFTLTLPLIEVAPSATDQSGFADALLVLDRNPIARGLFNALLEPHGTVVLAGSVEETVTTLAAKQVSRLLIDDATVRAEADSFATLRHVAHVAHAAGTEVLLLWPAVPEDERAAILATGVDHILTKPISRNSLVAALYPPEKHKLHLQGSLVSRAA